MEAIFFAKLFGLYFIIIGLIAIIRRCSIMPAVQDLAQNKGLIFSLALLEVVAGLSIVLAWPSVSWDWQGIIALIGWMMIVEGIVYLLLPARMVQRIISAFNKPAWYIGGGIVSVILGVYLAGIGFNLF